MKNSVKILIKALLLIQFLANHGATNPLGTTTGDGVSMTQAEGYQEGNTYQVGAALGAAGEGSPVSTAAIFLISANIGVPAQSNGVYVVSGFNEGDTFEEVIAAGASAEAALEALSQSVGGGQSETQFSDTKSGPPYSSGGLNSGLASFFAQSQGESATSSGQQALGGAIGPAAVVDLEGGSFTTAGASGIYDQDLIYAGSTVSNGFVVSDSQGEGVADAAGLNSNEEFGIGQIEFIVSGNGNGGGWSRS